MASWFESAALVAVMLGAVFGPFALAAGLSLAVVGKGLRRWWLLILLALAVPILCFAIFIFLSGAWYYQNQRFGGWLLVLLPPANFLWVVLLVLAAFVFRRSVARWLPNRSSSGREST
jgi:hypothetical protein